MGYAFPLLMFVAFWGLNATAAYYADHRIPQMSASNSATAAQNFITYKNAVTNFAAAHPAFSGTVSSAALMPYLNGLSSSFLANVSNSISTTGAGRTIIAYGQNLAAGTPSSVLSLTSNDAAIGYTNASGVWTSYSATVSSGLTLSVFNNNLVSVVVTN